MRLLRYFAEERPDLPVIAAGSLLEVALDRHRASFPVGRVEFLWLYPLTFAEYAAAAHEGSGDALAETPCPDYALGPARRLFLDYALVGGMPEIVSSWLNRRDVRNLSRLYEGLLVSFTDDAGKYARSPAQLARFRHVLETAPLVAGERITYQGFGASNYRSREMAEALRTLERAMLLYLLHPTTATAPPALPDRRKSPRLLFLDAGLANYRAGHQAGLLRTGHLAPGYRSRLVEHLVGLELLSTDRHTARKPRFWVRQRSRATAEVDYLHPYGNRLIPVEVKSGRSGALRSLHQFMERVDHDLAVRLRDGGIHHLHPAKTATGRKFRLLNLPYFLAHRLDAHLEWAEGQSL